MNLNASLFEEAKSVFERAFRPGSDRPTGAIDVTLDTRRDCNERSVTSYRCSMVWW